jgi:hypothetical protein
MKTRSTRTPRRPQWPPQPTVAPEGQTRPPADAEGNDLQLPHERDESTKTGTDAATPRESMRQAKADLDAGLVDTDMRATPGLDAQRREELLRKQRR